MGSDSTKMRNNLKFEQFKRKFLIATELITYSQGGKK